jgi:HD-like signal output (HDOD) protein
MTETTSVESTSLVDRIRKGVETGKISIPPLPSLVTQLMGLLRDIRNASSKRVAEWVRNDPAVAATLLRWANSATFGGLHPVTDLSVAIARLGLRETTSAVTTLAHSAHFASNDPEKSTFLETLWGHAVATAQAGRWIAGLVGADPEESYIAGLLHDTGKLLVLRGVDLIEKGENAAEITPAVLRELMDSLHTELGHRILSSWKLPEAFAEVALHHHDEDLTLESGLMMRIQVADAVARKIGEHPDPDPDLNLLDLPAVQLLNLGDIELANLMVDIEDELAQLKSML